MKRPHGYREWVLKLMDTRMDKAWPSFRGHMDTENGYSNSWIQLWIQRGLNEEATWIQKMDTQTHGYNYAYSVASMKRPHGYREWVLKLMNTIMDTAWPQ